MTPLHDLHTAFLACNQACTDTRNIAVGSIFFALKGANFDANSFAAEALQKGARYAVVDDPTMVQDQRFLLVPDVLKALQELATHHRRTFDIPVIGITGTNGKTTTKELLHSVLSANRSTLATVGNLNNHIGVPLTLLRLNQEHRVAIIEMGANKVGDIAELTAIAEPTHGMITNIGKAHLEGFGSYQGVISAKTEMYSFLSAHAGTAFVNGDDPLLMDKSKGLHRITYGQSEAFDTSGNATESEGPYLELRFHNKGRSTQQRITTKLIGDYNAPNALAAVCIAQHFAVPDTVIAQALSDYTPSNSRSEFRDTGRNHLIMDAYNANPTSMKMALENFAKLRSGRQKLAILGDMRELGSSSHLEHETIVRLAVDLGLQPVLVGEEFMKAAPEIALQRYRNVAAAEEAFQATSPTGLLVLVKGSRGLKLEEVAKLL